MTDDLGRANSRGAWLLPTCHGDSPWRANGSGIQPTISAEFSEGELPTVALDVTVDDEEPLSEADVSRKAVDNRFAGPSMRRKS